MAKLPMPFPNPRTYPGHSGVDYGQPEGTPVRASADGYVLSRGHNARGGYYVWVRYDGVTVGYHHLPSHEKTLPTNRSFKAGDILCVVGNTGNSTGPHLHSEVLGHATTAGYWRFFDRNRVIGSTQPATTEEGYPDMFIAIIRRKDWYLVTGGKACLLGAASGARNSGAPILEFVDDWAVKQLQSIVTGIK